MARIVIVCEGPTESEFCQDVLRDHFFDINQCVVQYPVIKASRGGIVAWNVLRKQIINHLSESPDVYVTTLIDYYGTYQKHEFPFWGESLKIHNVFDRMNYIENAMLNDIPESLRHRFIPYFQLHEFEALLLISTEVFQNNFKDEEFKNFRELRSTIEDVDNPETINTGRETAPSKRLQRLVVGYNKIVFGSCLATSIGLQNIRSKCVRFNNWITTMESISD